MSCKPIGKLLCIPQGIEIPGKPTRLAGIVKISCLYISTGSSDFDPISKAISGVVGDKLSL